MSLQHPFERLITVVLQADQFKQQQLATTWPELADALADLIEGTTEHDAPPAWREPAREPLTADASMALYGVLYEVNGTVLHPNEVTAILKDGRPHTYIVEQQR